MNGFDQRRSGSVDAAGQGSAGEPGPDEGGEGQLPDVRAERDCAADAELGEEVGLLVEEASSAWRVTAATS